MFNQVIVIGNLGRAPDFRTTQSEKHVCNLSLATSSGSGDKKRTEWHSIVCWAKTAEYARDHAKKGHRVLVVGELRTRKWHDDKANVDRYTTEIHVGGFGTTFRILESIGDGSRDGGDQVDNATGSDDVPDL